MLCSWCKRVIDRTKHASVVRKERLPNGGTFEYRYHAKPCYSSWKEFVAIHEFQPLDPSTHEHDEA